MGHIASRQVVFFFADLDGFVLVALLILVLVVIAEAEQEPAEPLPAGERDAPNTAGIARKVVHRDGRRVSATPEGRATAVETVRRVRRVLSVPLTVGGGVKRVADGYPDLFEDMVALFADDHDVALDLGLVFLETLQVLDAADEPLDLETRPAFDRQGLAGGGEPDVRPAAPPPLPGGGEEPCLDRS